MNQEENKEITLYEIEVEKQRNEEQKAIELREKKHRINNKWCDYMGWIFGKYRDKLEETTINVPEATGNILRKNGVMVDGISQDSIYRAFDLIIQNEKHIEDYLSRQRGKYSETMPYQ